MAEHNSQQIICKLLLIGMKQKETVNNEGLKTVIATPKSQQTTTERDIKEITHSQCIYSLISMF